MSGYGKPRKVFTLGLILANVVLALVVALELRAPLEIPSEEMAAAAEQRQEKVELPQANFLLPPLEDYAEIVERPLFIQERRPPPAQEAQVAPETAIETGAGAPPPFVLVGIVITPETKEALLLKPGQKDLIRGLIGQRFDGWKVDSIEPDRVVVSRGTGTTEIELERKSSALPKRKVPTRRSRHRRR